MFYFLNKLCRYSFCISVFFFPMNELVKLFFETAFVRGSHFVWNVKRRRRCVVTCVYIFYLCSLCRCRACLLGGTWKNLPRYISGFVKRIISIFLYFTTKVQPTYLYSSNSSTLVYITSELSFFLNHNFIFT